MSDSRKRSAKAAVATVVAVVAFVVIARYLHFYHDLNAGVAFGTDDHKVGFEWKGVFGPYADFGKIHLGR